MPATPKSCYEWRVHPHTGVTYQVEVPSQQGVIQHHQQASLQRQDQQSPRHSQQQQDAYNSETMNNQVQQQFTQHFDEQNSSTLSKHERVAGIVSLLEGGVTKKQPQVIDHAKKCPTKWAKQTTMNNVNLPLYAWGAVSELEASISGRSGAMSEGKMVGKLRHLKNVLEVCCLNTTAAEFSSYGWVLARDYAVKVENEVEQKLATWEDMAVGVRTATVLAAQMENPRKVEPPPRRTGGAGGAWAAGGAGAGAGLGAATARTKENCTTYNKCTTVGKCEFEVQNPDKSCWRKHGCSWCKANKGQSWNDQALKCKNKETAAQAGN